MAFKLPLFNGPMNPLVAKEFPCMRLAFSIRHPRPCTKSFYRFFQVGEFGLSVILKIIIVS